MKLNKLMFREYDIRGIWNEDITEEISYYIGRAYATKLLSLKKNIGKTILLFVIIVVITNLVIAGLSIQSATQKSMDQIRSSLGNDVTLSVDFRNMMKNREPGAAVSNETSLTTTMADSLKNLKYVESYNYQISTSADSDSISAVENKSDNSNNQQDTNKPNDQPEQALNQGDFTISANTTMEYLDSFTNSNYTLTDGRLLTSDDANTNNCVIETNLASDNDLSVGDTFTITTTVNDETITQELTIVGIYEIQSTNEIGSAHFNNPVNTIYTDLSIGQTLTGSSENITSAIYYLDDPENAEAFVELAKKKKAEAQSSMMSQKSTIYSEYIDSQQDQVEKHKQDLLNKNKEEAQLQENEFHKSMKNMEDLFTQNKDKWVDEIFTRCTK